MAVLDDIKTALRISVSTTAFDDEINDLIEAAKSDLVLAGVISEKADDTTDPLIKRAMAVYCKANFGWDNPDADRLQKAYDLLKMHLTLSEGYNSYAITFTVNDGVAPIDEATVTFNSVEKLTNASGIAVFYIAVGSNYEYLVEADGFESAEDDIDISAATTIEISLTPS